MRLVFGEIFFEKNKRIGNETKIRCTFGVLTYRHNVHIIVERLVAFDRSARSHVSVQGEDSELQRNQN